MELMDAVDNWIPLPPRDVDKPFYAETSVCGRGSTEPSTRQCELSWKQSEKNHGDIQRSG